MFAFAPLNLPEWNLVANSNNGVACLMARDLPFLFGRKLSWFNRSHPCLRRQTP